MAYTGELKQTLRHGNGTCVFNNNYFKYTGEWNEGRLHGHGVLCFGDGGNFEGDFDCGEIKGYGVRRWQDGTTYSGQFEDGELHGEGIQVKVTGEKYEGQWEHNKRHGLGELHYPNGDVYHGQFVCHKRHGLGKMKYLVDVSERMSYVEYNGMWKSGKRDGMGKMTTPYGYVFSGQWSLDKPQDVPKVIRVEPQVSTTNEEGTTDEADTSEVSNDQEREVEGEHYFLSQGGLLPPIDISCVGTEDSDNVLEHNTEEHGRTLRICLYKYSFKNGEGVESENNDDSKIKTLTPSNQVAFVNVCMAEEPADAGMDNKEIQCLEKQTEGARLTYSDLKLSADIEPGEYFLAVSDCSVLFDTMEPLRTAYIDVTVITSAGES